MRSVLNRHPALQVILVLPLGFALAATGVSRRTMIVIAFRIGLLVAEWLHGPVLLSLFKKLHYTTPPAKQSRPPRKPYISLYVVTFDDESVTVVFGDKWRESVRWADLVKVAITIEQEDFPIPYWILFGWPCKGGCVYSSEAVGAREMLRQLQDRLPQFDNSAVGLAMMMTSGGITVWEHPDGKTESEVAGA